VVGAWQAYKEEETIRTTRSLETTGDQMRVEQPAGTRKSLKWIQRAINERWSSLEAPLLARLPAGTDLQWLSPLAADAFAEYRDAAFVSRIGHPELESQLREFWPSRGPQWDALARGSLGDVLLVEAKAHIAEMCSPGTAAGAASAERIRSALEAVAAQIGARADRADWTRHFYQLANRLAHLDFLRRNGIPAWLVLVGFTNDADVGGPSTSEAWDAAYEVAFHVMGIPRRNSLSSWIIHVTPSVIEARGGSSLSGP